MKFNVDLATLVSQIDDLSTVLQAASSAGLVDALKDVNPLTVFAPDNDAFAKMPVGTVESLMNDKEKLTAVLNYHIVPGRLLAADLGKQKKWKTMQGDMLEVHEQHWMRHGIKINDAAVKEGNLECTNGVVHIIDSVLMPE
jgi:uncharacterized surface protein with fasciclin (FAS1) repeats